METGALACAYATLILDDEGIEVNAENLSKVVAAAGIELEPFWPDLYVSMASTTNIKELLTSVSSGGGGGGAAAGGAAAGGDAGAGDDAASSSESSSSDGDMGFSLFD
eukprot:TRINITY_DN2766_c0_g1_i3.p5 TRINITY_DN2766_c0_g1~~TRINITY_DN2766_c0_g1_i3.p5  ORF type:complete len:108 (-),score=40.24 TRINITY_DN2766_c0_g1_i3:33-356(-)